MIRKILFLLVIFHQCTAHGFSSSKNIPPEAIVLQYSSCFGKEYRNSLISFHLKDNKIIRKTEFLENGKVTNAMLYEMQNCLILDSKNWKCGKYGVEITVVNGIYYENLESRGSCPDKWKQLK
jgi:hypothetical protein